MDFTQLHDSTDEEIYHSDANNSVNYIENTWNHLLNDDLKGDTEKSLISKFLPRSPEFNDRIRIVNLTKLLEMHMENSNFKVMDEKTNKKFLFNISLQIGAMYAVSNGLRKRFERISHVEYMKKLWMYMTYLHHPLKNDKIGKAFMDKLFEALKGLLTSFPKMFNQTLMLEEQRDKLINLTKNISSILLEKEVCEQRLRIHEFRMETNYNNESDILIKTIRILFPKMKQPIIDDATEYKTKYKPQIDKTLNSIKKLENDVRNIFKKSNENVVESEFCMGLMHEFDCLKFVKKALLSFKTFHIPATKEFTITENEIPILQAIVFLGETVTNAAGIRESQAKDKTIVRALISLRNAIVHKMNDKKIDDYFWHGILKELKEDLLEKIEKRLDQLQMIFLEADPTKLINIKNEPYLYDDNIAENQIEKVQKGKKPKTITAVTVISANPALDKILDTPAWQNHDYKFLRSFLRVLQYNDYDVEDPLKENISDIAKNFIDAKTHKPQPQKSAKDFRLFIENILENVVKIDELCNSIVLSTLAERLENDSTKDDIRLFLSLSFYLDQICQTIKDIRYENPNAHPKVESELWKTIAKKLYKIGKQRLFEYLYNQIENGRNLCIHHSWINESEYQRFANVICLVLSNLKPMFLQLLNDYKQLHRKRVFLRGVHYFTKSLIIEIQDIDKIINKYKKKKYTFCYVIGEIVYDAEMLEIDIKQDEELKLFFQLHSIIDQIYNILHECRSSNNLLWKRLESDIPWNKRHILKDIYCQLEYTKNITPRSLWKNKNEYRTFADTVFLLITDLKPMLLNAGKNKYFDGQKLRIRKNMFLWKLRKRSVFSREIHIRKNTCNLWWQLLLIKCSVTEITTKDHFSDVNPNWAKHLAKRICENNHAATILYIRVKNIVIKLLEMYFKYHNTNSKKLHLKIVSVLKKHNIVSGDVQEKNVSNLIETVVKRYVECIKNLDKLDAWEYEDYKILDLENLIPALNKSLHRSKAELNLHGLHERTPLLYVLSLHDYNPFANMFDQKHIQNLVKVLLHCGADPDKFNALTLHPLHYAALISPSFKKWFQKECILKNPCDGLYALNPQVFSNHNECFFRDFENISDNEIERESFVDDSFYNAIAIADKIHHSFPNYVIDLDYYLNLYDQKGQTPLICATDAQYFHIDWKNNLDIIINSGASVDEKEITAFENGKTVYGDNSLTKILKFNMNVNSLGICLSTPQNILNIKKEIVEYLVANGADKNEVKHLAANSLFLTVQSKRALQEQNNISDENLEDIDRIIEFWFEITVLLHDLSLVEAYQNFYYNFDNWIQELMFDKNIGIKIDDKIVKQKSDKSQKLKTSGLLSCMNDISEDFVTPKEKAPETLTDCKKYVIEKEIPPTEFIIFPNKNLIIVDPNDDNLFWEYSFVSPDYYKCLRCKEKNVEVSAHIKTTANNEKYVETNQIQHACEIQNFEELNKISKRSEYESEINLKGIQELTIFHPTDKQWIFELEYDKDLETFYCVKCKHHKHTVTTAFWKNKKGEEVVVLSMPHLCYLMAKLFP